MNVLLTKYLLGFADYWTIFAYTRIGEAISLIPIAFAYFPELMRTIKEHGRKVIIVMFLNEFLNILGVLFVTIAIAIGFVTLIKKLKKLEFFKTTEAEKNNGDRVSVVFLRCFCLRNFLEFGRKICYNQSILTKRHILTKK